MEGEEKKKQKREKEKGQTDGWRMKRKGAKEREIDPHRERKMEKQR